MLVGVYILYGKEKGAASRFSVGGVNSSRRDFRYLVGDGDDGSKAIYAVSNEGTRC